MNYFVEKSDGIYVADKDSVLKMGVHYLSNGYYSTPTDFYKALETDEQLSWIFKYKLPYDI